MPKPIGVSKYSDNLCAIVGVAERTLTTMLRDVSGNQPRPLPAVAAVEGGACCDASRRTGDGARRGGRQAPRVCFIQRFRRGIPSRIRRKSLDNTGRA